MTDLKKLYIVNRGLAFTQTILLPHWNNAVQESAFSEPAIQKGNIIEYINYGEMVQRPQRLGVRSILFLRLLDY
jgi:hypothetical protein